MIADLERRLRISEARWRQERERARDNAECHPLRRTRLERGWSQAVLGRLSGVSTDVISRAERSDPTVSLASWRRLSASLGCRIDELTAA